MKRLFVLILCGWWVVSLVPSLSAAAEATADAWQPLRVPGFWERQFGGIVEAHDGFAWYRCVVRVPADWQGQAAELGLGQIDDCDETFFNGEKVGSSGSIQPFRSASHQTRKYAVPLDKIRFGEDNLIAVRVWDGGGAGGIAAGRVELSTANQSLSLQGKWQFRTGDDPAWARWPGGAGSDASVELARAFEREAGPGFGRLRKIDRSPLAGTSALMLPGDIASNLVMAPTDSC